MGSDLHGSNQLDDKLVKPSSQQTVWGVTYMGVINLMIKLVKPSSQQTVWGVTYMGVINLMIN